MRLVQLGDEACVTLIPLALFSVDDTGLLFQQGLFPRLDLAKMNLKLGGQLTPPSPYRNRPHGHLP
jgi:hypothetical protein